MLNYVNHCLSISNAVVDISTIVSSVANAQSAQHFTDYSESALIVYEAATFRHRKPNIMYVVLKFTCTLTSQIRLKNHSYDVSVYRVLCVRKILKYISGLVGRNFCLVKDRCCPGWIFYLCGRSTKNGLKQFVDTVIRLNKNDLRVTIYVVTWRYVFVCMVYA